MVIPLLSHVGRIIISNHTKHYRNDGNKIEKVKKIF